MEEFGRQACVVNHMDPCDLITPVSVRIFCRNMFVRNLFRCSDLAATRGAWCCIIFMSRNYEEVHEERMGRRLSKGSVYHMEKVIHLELVYLLPYNVGLNLAGFAYKKGKFARKKLGDR